MMSLQGVQNQRRMAIVSPPSEEEFDIFYTTSFLKQVSQLHYVHPFPGYTDAITLSLL